LSVFVLQKSFWWKNKLPPCTDQDQDLSRLEEEDGDLSKVEVDEVLGLVGDVGAKVAAHDAVPGGVVLLVKLFLDEGGDVLLDVVLLEGLRGAVDSVLLHVLRHVGILDHGLAFCHLDGFLGCSRFNSDWSV